MFAIKYKHCGKEIRVNVQPRENMFKQQKERAFSGSIQKPIENVEDTDPSTKKMQKYM